MWQQSYGWACSCHQTWCGWWQLCGYGLHHRHSPCRRLGHCHAGRRLPSREQPLGHQWGRREPEVCSCRRRQMKTAGRWRSHCCVPTGEGESERQSEVSRGAESKLQGSNTPPTHIHISSLLPLTYSIVQLVFTHKLNVPIQQSPCSCVTVITASENTVAGVSTVPQQGLGPADHSHSREAQKTHVHFHLARRTQNAAQLQSSKQHPSKLNVTLWISLYIPSWAVWP